MNGNGYMSKRERLERKAWDAEHGRITYLNEKINELKRGIREAASAEELQVVGLELKQFRESGDSKEVVTAYDGLKNAWVEKLSATLDNALNEANTSLQRVKEIESNPPIFPPTEEEQKKAEVLENQIEMQFSGNQMHDKTVIAKLMKAVESGNLLSALAATRLYKNHSDLFLPGNRPLIYKNAKTEAQKAQERLDKQEINHLRGKMVDAQKTIFRCRTMQTQIADKL